MRMPQIVPKLLSAAVLFAAVYALLPTLYFRRLAKPIPRSPNKRTVWLTFDDGPDPRYTPRLLDILKANRVQATFFVVAEKALENPDIIRRITAEGHVLGFHGCAHCDAWKTSPLHQIRDFRSGLGILRDLGCRPAYYRAPWGHLTLISLLAARKYHLKTVLWTVMAQDWSGPGADVILERLIGRTKSGSVICLHDSGCGPATVKGAPEQTLAAVRRFLPIMLGNGFTFAAPGRKPVSPVSERRSG